MTRFSAVRMTLAVVVLTAAFGVVNSGPAFAGTASDGQGTMAVTPTSVTAGSTGNQFSFTFTTQNGKDFPSGSAVALTVPTGWTQPSTTAGTAGYTTASPSGCTLGTLTTTPVAGGWTIQVPMACPGGSSFTINYGAGTNATHVTAPTAAGSATFTAQSRSGSAGTLTTLGNGSGSPVVTVNTGAASKLAFTTSPSNSTAGAAFPTQPAVTVQDAFGNPVTNDLSTATLSITAGTPTSGGPGTLSGCTQSESNGVISFAGCKINTAGTGYKLHAVDGTLTAADSAAFTVTAGAAAQLAFTQQPAGATGGTAFGTQPRVTVQDAFGNPVTTDASTVTLSITTGTPTGGGPGTLSGCTQSESNGVVGFAGCKINTTGTGYKLHAVDGALATDSATFSVTVGAPAQLAFTTAPPSTGTAGSGLASFAVSVQDAGGNTITSGAGSTDTVSLSIAAGPAGGTINSAPSTYANVPASTGVATFGGLVFNTAGSYTLTASDTQPGDTGLTRPTSGTITIGAATPSKLAFVQGPSAGFAGAALSPAITVQVQDQYGNAAADGGVVVTLTPSTGVIDSGATATTSAAGLATFSAVTINQAATGLTVTASAPGLTATAASSAFDVTVLASNGAALTDTASDGAGAGVQMVAYYYCAGYSGSCTSANWTSIGSSVNPAANYLVSWTNQPANGQYRLVVVGTDNVGNASVPSATIPVTVSN